MARQPFVADWFELPSGSVEQSTTTTFTLDSLSKDFVTVGDRLKIIYSNGSTTAIRYRFVISVNSSTVTIDKAISLTGYTITNAYLSKDTNPSGFTLPVSYTPTLTGDGTITISDSGNVSAYYFVFGSLCWYSVARSSVVLGGSSGSYIYESLPINYKGGTSFCRFAGYLLQSASSNNGVGMFSLDTSYDDVVTIFDPNGLLDTGGEAHSFTVIYPIA